MQNSALTTARVPNDRKIRSGHRPFRLNLLRGLKLQKLEAQGPLAGGQFTASMDPLRHEHRPGDLLGGRLTVTEVVLERPRLELVSTADSAAPGSTDPAPEATAEGSEDAAAESEGTSLDLAISSIRLEDGSLVQRTVTGDDTEAMAIQGLGITLNDLTFGSRPAAGGETPVASGEIRIGEILLATTVGEGPASVQHSEG